MQKHAETIEETQSTKNRKYAHIQPLKEGDSIVSLVNSMIEEAYTLRASDIHINPTEENVRVRMRIDGVLQDTFICKKNIHSEIISRIKVLSGLRTDEHQAAQDGRFRLTLSKVDAIDIRVSITPTYYGENAVLRLLGDKAEDYTLTSLGFSEKDQKHILRAIKRPHGMILSTGPTGSGKTTTLYTLIKMLSTPDVSIVTIEDPIEYAMSEITQIQINPRSGLTFANGLRSILRQDPNVIMVGEIRDAETAGIAVNTALTGHLLLSTLHTNDAATTLPRLLDMGIDGYLVASTVNIAIGQRLIRRICEACKTEYKPSEAEEASLRESLPKYMQTNGNFFHGKGCDECSGSGYKGRIGVNEVLVVDQDIREAILSKASASVIKGIAVKNGMTTMLEEGFNKAARGETTIAEVLRTIND
jgi:type II secretory ATPase GspE/PulE/Tfp pilus assembly ATPase PilB-like protein